MRTTTRCLLPHARPLPFLAALLAVALALGLAAFPMQARADPDEAEPNYDVNETPPEKATGTCQVDGAWLGDYTSWGSHCYFNVASFDGFLAGQSGTAVCIDPGSDSLNHGTYTYEATRTAWDPETGKVSYSVVITPPGACTGDPYTTADKPGYQRAAIGELSFVKVQTAVIQLEKSSADTQLSSTCGAYDLAGAQYEVRDAAGELCCTLTTGKDGKTEISKQLPNGTYTFKEVKAAPGFALDPETHTIEVSSTKAERGLLRFPCTDVPAFDTAGLLLEKLDAETGEPIPLAASSLAKAEFTVDYFPTLFDEPDERGTQEPERSWILATDEAGKACFDEAHLVAGDALFANAEGTIVLPVGTYLIHETKAPEGYVADSATYVRKVELDEGMTEATDSFAVLAGEDAIHEQAIRGDASFVKCAQGSQRRLAGIPFLVTAQSTGETHLVTTDENGCWASTTNFESHESHTNANDAAMVGLETKQDDEGRWHADTDKVELDEGRLLGACGTWFGRDEAGNQAEPDDALGALPYDTYDFVELPCQANAGLTLATFELTVSRHGYVVDLGTVTDEVTEVTEHPETPEPDEESPAEEDQTPADETPYAKTGVDERMLLAAGGALTVLGLATLALLRGKRAAGKESTAQERARARALGIEERNPHA